MDIENSGISNNDISNNGIINKNKNKKILVIGGGGIKGIGYIGALNYLEESGKLKDIEIYAGTSIGGLLCGLLYIGYTAKKLKNLTMKLNLNKLQKINISNLFVTYGFDDGLSMTNMLMKMFAARGYDDKTTFKQLFEKTNKKIVLTGTCINDKSVHYFSYETQPDMPLLLAMRITISFPIYFSPIKYNDLIYIDGGCIDSYPLNLFDKEINDVIGIHAAANVSNNNINDINNLEDYIINVFQSLFNKQNRTDNTIIVNIENINILNFNIDKKFKKNLLDIGYDAAKNYVFS